MEISERELRALAREVDDRHRDGMTTAAADLAELHAETRRFRPDRRRFLATLAGLTAAAAIGGAAPALAQESTTTTAVPLKDDDIAAFAESLELAAVEAYKAAAASGKLDKPVIDVGTMFAAHHLEHARAFAGQAGSSATGKPNPKVLDIVAGQLRDAPDQAAILKVAFDVENAAAGTYLFALGALTGSTALALTASILPVESQHAVVLGSALGKKVVDIVPTFETKDKAIDPVKFPVAK